MDTAMSISILVNSILFLISGMFGFCSYTIRNSIAKSKSKCTQKTRGKVADICCTKVGHNFGEQPSYSWSPVFTYVVNGQEFTRKSRRGSAENMYQVNQDVDIFYNPANPEECYVEDRGAYQLQSSFLSASIILLLSCAIALGISVFLGLLTL